MPRPRLHPATGTLQPFSTPGSCRCVCVCACVRACMCVCDGCVPQLSAEVVKLQRMLDDTKAKSEPHTPPPPPSPPPASS